MTIQAFAALMKKYLKAVDRVGTAPSTKSYKERTEKERTLRIEVKDALAELVAQEEKDKEWLDEAKEETPAPKKRGLPKKIVEPTPVDAEPPSEGESST